MTAAAEFDVTGTLVTLRDYIRWAASRFAAAGLHFGHGTANPLDEAAALVLHVLHQPHDLPPDYFGAALTHDERQAVVELIARRIDERKPLAYLTHEAWFADLPFYVDERVLVPRSPIAELIGKRFAPWVDPERVHAILDLCTGSGCVAIACAYAFPDARVDAVEWSPDALAVASENIRRHRVEEQVELIASDLCAALGSRRYDLIISNPPYVSSEEWAQLPAEYHAEPKVGLEAGADGLDCIRRILQQAESHLNPMGALIVEVGSSAEALLRAFPEIPFIWLELEHGGDGVFLLTAEQVRAAQPLLAPTF